MPPEIDSKVTEVEQALYDNKAFWDTIYAPLEGGFTSALWCATIFVVLTLPCTVIAYKKKLMDLRAGKPSFYANHALYEGYHATCFYGAYISFVALGYVLLYIVVFIIVWTLFWGPTWDAFWKPFLKWLAWWLISWILDRIWLRTKLFQTWCVDGDNNNWIVRPELYAFVDTSLTCYYVPQQAAAAIYRTLYLMCFAIIGCFRVDVDMMPHGAETYDSGFTCFTACMLMHERQRHPVLMTFFHLASQPSRAPRVSHVARNRWTLALLLLKNPSLRKYRRRLPEDCTEADVATQNPIRGMDEQEKLKGDQGADAQVCTI
eukprot:TRINITY_DN20207_c0_g1_i1.p1 TRINITY_DN20207_c0_g1~~TRINITY_DN20207_c0_g1_i1.p1  ORF type:complete len:318 (-),score=68.17 TRINITY_DN20207_c0_g1_i1:212-1165(-)